MAAIALTAAEIAAATGGTIVSGDPARRVERWSIDTRTLQRGDLFVAIRGDRFDGHEFVASALAAGAAGAVVTATPALPEAGNPSTGSRPSRGEGGPAPLLIKVADTTRALQDGAREVRRRSGAKVVAITGSAGKTTTKELTAEFLAGTRTVFRNKGNLNNHIGLPLSLLELRSKPDVAVVELGMSHPGEIRTLVGIAEPEVRVWTNVGDAHLGFFASADAIADAKAEILEQARPGDLLVSNADDERIQSRAQWFGGRILTFGLSDRAHVRASAVRHRGLDGMSAIVTSPAGTFEIETPLLGSGNLLNVLAAAAVAIDLGVPTDQISARAAAMKPAAHRGELLRLPGGVTLIDDSYNSSPAALTRALETVAAATGSARKIAVLGEMLELGEHSVRLHEESGVAAAAAGLAMLITVGGEAAERMADAALAAGVPTVIHAAHSDEATRVVLQRVRPGDLVLVKGSRGIRTDIVVDRLKAEFA
ncbi:MAG TPA: UDP-N-acetylmuramoyl-tripeptide--D-alanyl-D-alanine ligase [Vicinamibacterales bacterium]|nr:UDP-N-acetylmuramoyl-tripeptide--D-alanyl-D-alanine ligase [Vicinamibacterales bacterium]